MDQDILCPVETCRGWVCQVDGFWGCGECGNVWHDRAALDQAITEVIRKRHYRAGCYVKSETGWAPSPEGEPPGYERLVQAEWDK